MSTVSQHLQQIEASGLIRLASIEPDLEYLFRHALVQDAAYESLLRQDRKRLHLSVAESLETLYPDHPDDLAPMLANHFYHADDPRALKYFLQAGDAAFRMYANHEAIAHYSHALEIVGETPEQDSQVTSEQLIHLCLRCGRAYQFASQLDEAIAFYEQMTAMARERGDKALELTAQVEYTTILCTPNTKADFAKGKALSEQMLILARELGDRRAEARILWTLMLPGRFEGDALAAIYYGEQALAIAREVDWHDQMAYILNDLTFCYLSAGRLAQAKTVNVEARELWRKVGNLPMLADTLAGAITIYYLYGEYDQAIDVSNEAYQISQTIDNLWGQSYSGLIVDQVYLDRGEFDKVFEIGERTLTLGAKAGFLAPEINTRATLGLAYGYLGAFREGLEQAYMAYREAQHYQLPWISLGNAVIARLYARNGDADNATTFIRQGYESLNNATTRSSFSPELGWIPFADAELALARADYAYALSVINRLEAVIATVGEIGTAPFLPDGLILKGKALLGLDQLEAAHSVFYEARDRAMAMGARWYLWQIFDGLSQIEAKLGNLAQAERYHQQAREIVTYIAEHTGRADLRESFLALPHVRAVMNNS